jgi:hypothetical protein
MQSQNLAPVAAYPTLGIALIRAKRQRRCDLAQDVGKQTDALRLEYDDQGIGEDSLPVPKGKGDTKGH